MSTEKEDSSKTFLALGKRIAEVREKSGLSQQAFADRVGVSQRQISSYESGRDRPRRAARQNICREFNVREEWLNRGEGPAYKEGDDTIDPDRPFKHLSSEQKKQLARQMLEEIFATRGVEKVWDHLVHQLVVLLAVDPDRLSGLDLDDVLKRFSKETGKK